MTEHNWDAISKGAIPSSIGVVLAFANMTTNWRWGVSLLCMIFAYIIISFYSKKKSDLFSGVALVFVTGIVMHLLSLAGLV
jgi:hypothetical protein